MRLRADRYNKGICLAWEFEKQGKVLIVSLDDTEGVDTLKRDKNALHALYEKGFHDGECISKWLDR